MKNDSDRINGINRIYEQEPENPISREVLVQYAAARFSFAILDRSDVGKIAVRGADRFTWLQGMVSNDVRLLADGKVNSLPACILNATGHLLSDVTLISPTSEQPFVLMVLPRGNVEKILALLDRFIIMEDVELADVSHEFDCLSYQGLDIEET